MSQRKNVNAKHTCIHSDNLQDGSRSRPKRVSRVVARGMVMGWRSRAYKAKNHLLAFTKLNTGFTFPKNNLEKKVNNVSSLLFF